MERRPLNVDAGALLAALTARDEGLVGTYVDLREGALLRLYDPAVVGRTNDALEARIDSDPDRYAKVPLFTRDFRLMAEFVDTVDDDDLARLLDTALSGRGAFRRFEAVLAGCRPISAGGRPSGRTRSPAGRWAGCNRSGSSPAGTARSRRRRSPKRRHSCGSRCSERPEVTGTASRAPSTSTARPRPTGSSSVWPGSSPSCGGSRSGRAPSAIGPGSPAAASSCGGGHHGGDHAAQVTCGRPALGLEGPSSPRCSSACSVLARVLRHHRPEHRPQRLAGVPLRGGAAIREGLDDLVDRRADRVLRARRRAAARPTSASSTSPRSATTSGGATSTSSSTRRAS